MESIALTAITYLLYSSLTVKGSHLCLDGVNHQPLKSTVQKLIRLLWCDRIYYTLIIPLNTTPAVPHIPGLIQNPLYAAVRWRCPIILLIKLPYLVRPPVRMSLLQPDQTANLILAQLTGTIPGPA